MQKFEYCKTDFLIFVDNVIAFSFALLSNCFEVQFHVSPGMNLKFIVLISNLSHTYCRLRILLEQL
jgi:hypothetical protein